MAARSSRNGLGMTHTAIITKRGVNMAKKRSDGRVQVSFRTEDGKRHYVYGANKREAEQKKLELMKKLADGVMTRDITLDRFFDAW